MELEQKNKKSLMDGLRNVIYNVFCAVIFLLPLLPEIECVGTCSLKNTLFNLTTITTMIALIIIDLKEKIFKFTFYDFLTSCYLVFVVLSTIFSKYGFKECFYGTNGRGEGLLTIFSYIVTFTICYKGYNYIQKTFKVALTGAVIICIYGIIQANVPLSVKLPFGSSATAGVAEGTMGNQNFLASYLSIFLPMMCYYFVKAKDNRSLVVVILLFITLVFTKTLSCYTTFIVMYVIVIIFSILWSTKKKRTIQRLLILTLIIVLPFIAIAVVKGDAYVNELTGIKKEVANLAEGDDSFATGRLLIWKKTLLVINNNKLLGVGPDSLKMELQDAQYDSENRDWMDVHIVDKAHSEYLQIAVTTGIPSLVIYLVLLATIGLRIVSILVKIHKNNPEHENKVFITMILIGIISYLGQAIGNISVVQVAPVFWVVLGLGAGITLNEKIINDKENQKISTL